MFSPDKYYVGEGYHLHVANVSASIIFRGAKEIAPVGPKMVHPSSYIVATSTNTLQKTKVREHLYFLMAQHHLLLVLSSLIDT